MPFVQVILGVHYHSLLQLGQSCDLLVETDVLVVGFAQVNELVEPAEVAILAVRLLVGLLLLLLLLEVLVDHASQHILLLPVHVSDTDQIIHLFVDVVPESVLLVIFVVLFEMALKWLDRAAVEELHGHHELLALDPCSPHEFEFVVELFEHVLLLLHCASDLLVADVVNFLLYFGDAPFKLVLDECVQPYFVLLTQVADGCFLLLGLVGLV